MDQNVIPVTETETNAGITSVEVCMPYAGKKTTPDLNAPVVTFSNMGTWSSIELDWSKNWVKKPSKPWKTAGMSFLKQIPRGLR